METVRAVFHDIWATIEAQDSIRITANHADLKAAIVRKLLDLVADGTTTEEELKGRSWELAVRLRLPKVGLALVRLTLQQREHYVLRVRPHRKLGTPRPG